MDKKPEIIKETASFEKIDVPQTVVPIKKSGKKKKILLGAGIFLVSILILAVVSAFALQGVYRNGAKLVSSGRTLAQQLKTQNIEEAKKTVPVVRSDLIATQNALTPLSWVKAIPFVRGYYLDAQHGLAAGLYGLDALEITVGAVEPYADLLGLKGKSTFVSGSADDRIQTAVKTLDKVTPKLAEIGTKIELLKKEIDPIDPNRYPQTLGGKKIRENLVLGKNLLEETTGLFINARPFLEELPHLLGEPEPKRYLVLFQNDKELRPTGGFITAFAVFKMQGGKPVVERSEDIYVLDEQHGKNTPAPELIRTYHKGVYQFYLRDSNTSPDFAVSVKQFQELYGKDFDFDGVIAVDTHVLVEALKILGSFNISGREFSSEIDKRCDCPKVVYELEDYSTRPVAYVRSARKDILGELLLQIMKKALGVSPSQYWGNLVQMGISEINQKHILANMRDEKTQKAVELLNMAGRIANGSQILGYTDSVGWDYLHINDANFAGAKSNLFVEEEVKIDYQKEGDSIIKSVTIDYKNPFPASDCNLESGGLCLNGELRNLVRIYVPKGSQLLESKGGQNPSSQTPSPKDLIVKEDLGKTVFEGFLTVRPLGSAQLTFTYKVPIKPGKNYRMLIQKQPGTNENQYTISVNGKQRDQFKLKTDQVINISL